MGLRGPRPKPTAVKQREGTYRADRAPTHEPKPESEVPPCPAGVRTDKDAKACWDALSTRLEKLGLLSAIDGAALEGLCRSYSVAVKADRALKKGVTLKTMYGIQAHPAVAISRLAWAEVRKFASEFGLTPAARTRVNAPAKKAETDEAEAFLFGGANGKVAGAIRPA